MRPSPRRAVAPESPLAALAPVGTRCSLTSVRADSVAQRVLAAGPVAEPRTVTGIAYVPEYGNSSSCGHFGLWKVAENRTAHVK